MKLVVEPGKNDKIYIVFQNNLQGTAKVNFWNVKDDNGAVWSSISLDDQGEIFIQNKYIIFYKILENNNFEPKQINQQPTLIVEDDSGKVVEDDSDKVKGTNMVERARALSAIHLNKINKTKKDVNKVLFENDSPQPDYYTLPGFFKRKV